MVMGIDKDGNLSILGTVDGRDVATDGTKLDGIEAGADVTDAVNVAAAGAPIIVSMPTLSTDPGSAGQIAMSGDEFAWYDTGSSEWRFVTGVRKT